MQIVIVPNGSLRCIYNESLELASLGRLTIERGSHVEPDLSGNWWADLSLVSGPKLGPFLLRSAALTAEAEWLENYWLTQSSA